MKKIKWMHWRKFSALIGLTSFLFDMNTQMSNVIWLKRPRCVSTCWILPPFSPLFRKQNEKKANKTFSFSSLLLLQRVNMSPATTPTYKHSNRDPIWHNARASLSLRMSASKRCRMNDYTFRRKRSLNGWIRSWSRLVESLKATTTTICRWVVKFHICHQLMMMMMVNYLQR